MLSYEEAESLHRLSRDIPFVKGYKNLESCSAQVLPLFGLRSIKPPFWIRSSDKTSYLEIVDERKWFLSKIKYGV